MTRSGGSLVAVGIGIRPPAQTTFEAASTIKNAEKVFALVPEPHAYYWMRTLNANMESLGHLYEEGKDRRETYRQIVERITGAVRSGLNVCAASYGHPGVAAFPFHEAIRVLRNEGFSAKMLAGISSADCLFAELGVDPTNGGCLSYEATDFLLRRRPVDPACNLILWQIGVIAEPGYKHCYEAWNQRGIGILTERLLETYAAEHEVVVYEAASVTPCDPVIVRVALGRLNQTRVSVISTLFVPPAIKRPFDEMIAQRLAG